ncbi:heme ABC exporter ATP-binding protein CcmA [Dermacoccus sp. 147Ba]|uniref:heme ABC exporter ATP-binding protein CcmA n=1 Tax=Dermacoccus sp. 147Ba TaxID=2510111 RepID=UPI00197A8B5F|nr:heme ABC exporter ATP-binding protein CcmA [Dermacoccus sp. 147Ba]
MLEVESLQRSFGGVRVVDDLTFTLAAGEVVALVGANGAGKTTTLRCIAGLDECDGGAVLWDGSPLDERDSATRREVCALLDDTAWFPDLTVAEHLAILARAHGEEARVVVDALDALGLADLGDRMPATLSSGQTQRLRLAQALARPWRLLVLDEPEQRLDADGREWLGHYLRACADEGRAVLMASHDHTLCAIAGARLLDVERAHERADG